MWLFVTRMISGVFTLVRDEPIVLIVGIAFAIYTSVAAHFVRAAVFERALLVIWGLLFPALFFVMLFVGMPFAMIPVVGVLIPTGLGTCLTALVAWIAFPGKLALTAAISSVIAVGLLHFGLLILVLYQGPSEIDWITITMIAWNFGFATPLLVGASRIRKRRPAPTSP